jgi:hypothetical protein
MNPQKINVGLILPPPPPPTSKSMSRLQKRARGVLRTTQDTILVPKNGPISPLIAWIYGVDPRKAKF